MIRIALVGQPNCGKSTIFNHLVGYKANTSNLPGTTVEYLKSETLINGKRAEVIDLPGTYSLSPVDQAETETRNFLRSGKVDAVLNVADASLLSRSLELTLQLLEMGIPLVVCLNMLDEAKRKGITVDLDKLSAELGVPVVPTIAVRGIGVKRVASQTIKAATSKVSPPSPVYSADVEAVIEELGDKLTGGMARRFDLPPRLLAIKLLDGDPDCLGRVKQESFGLYREANRLRDKLGKLRGRRGEEVLSAERHSKAMEIYERAATVGRPTVGIRDRLDALLMHKVWGYLFLGAIMYGLFFVVFKVGSLIEGPMMEWFNQAVTALGTVMPADSIWFAVMSGLIQGVAGALGFVLPYLIPFWLGLALLEDAGYLPRVGYLMDVFMHRVGLHGKSVIPFILGYGCSVPAVLATRILDSPRDRFVTAVLAVMVPCAARTTVILGLVGYFLGPTIAFALYVVNLFVVAIAGKIMTKVFPRVTPGLILEIPTYKVPSLRVITSKVWIQAREFIILAWPLLIGGSIVLSLFEYGHINYYLNLGLLPITWALGLPMAIGVTLIFGIFRKELTLIMLFQALGTTSVASVLSAGQMITFTLFVMFYIPCVATIIMLWHEFGMRKTALVLGFTTGTALLVGVIARGIASIIH